jgi:hypothetical protein
MDAIVIERIEEEERRAAAEYCSSVCSKQR